MSNKLVLIDGNSVIYRAFFALPLLNNDKGVYTNAVYGFTNMLLKILEDEQRPIYLSLLTPGKQRSDMKHIRNIKADDRKRHRNYRNKFRC